jgi:phenylacetate-CoA ligase
MLVYLGNGQRRIYWDKEKLRAFQERKLHSIVKYAYDFVPFYHRKFKESKVLPSNIKHLSDLSKLPIIKKDEIKRQSIRHLISLQFDPANLKTVRTSGSTGQPFQIFLTGAEDDWRKSIYMRANINCGQKPRDHWVVLTSPYHFSDTTNLQRRLGIFAQNCVSVFSSTPQQLKQVEEARPNVLDGYSGSLFLLAKEARRQGRDSINPRMMFGTAEYVGENSIKFIEHTFGAPYYDQFGCAEVDRTAWMCPFKTGYHMDVDSVITEFVDDEGKNTSPGERGEIVYTSLFNFAMPLVRYAVGDLGIPTDEVCGCGRQLPLMKAVEGRKKSFLILSDGQLISPNILEVVMNMFEQFCQIEQFRIVQKKRDVFKVFIELDRRVTDQSSFKDKLIKHLVTNLNQLVPGSNLSEAYFDGSSLIEFPLTKLVSAEQFTQKYLPEEDRRDRMILNGSRNLPSVSWWLKALFNNLIAFGHEARGS